jgi:hypothetical protein
MNTSLGELSNAGRHDADLFEAIAPQPTDRVARIVGAAQDDQGKGAAFEDGLYLGIVAGMWLGKSGLKEFRAPQPQTV